MSLLLAEFLCTSVKVINLENLKLSNEIDKLFCWQPEHRINGLEPTVVAAIPTMKFNREAFSSTEEDAQ